MKESWIMDEMEKTDAQGSPSRKAQKALGEKLNRPSKPPPAFPSGKLEKNEPPARRVADEVGEL